MEEHNGNSQGLWKVFGRILNNKKRSCAIDKIVYDNKEITSKPLIAEKFNNYFCSIGEELSEKFDKNYVSYKTYLRNPLQSLFYFHLINENEIGNIIDKLEKKKSPGYDDIPVKFLQIIKSIITIIINIQSKCFIWQLS